MSDEGLVTVKSEFSVLETIDRLTSAITSKGLSLFARIDHAAGAAAVGMQLRPMVLLVFGNPKVGTMLMQEKPTSGIDLPVKVLAWEDAEGFVWLTYNDATWLAKRHGLGPASDTTVQAINAGLASLVRVANGS
jgi:uncharacterized protein (DUF302 family)